MLPSVKVLLNGLANQVAAEGTTNSHSGAELMLSNALFASTQRFDLSGKKKKSSPMSLVPSKKHDSALDGVLS